MEQENINQTSPKSHKKILIPIIAAAALAVTAAVLLILLCGRETYRLIKVNSFEGGVTVFREESDPLAAFKGLSLASADRVEVAEASFLELLADEDKHIGAEENTGFVVTASGTSKKGGITIDLLYGKALFTIDNKLGEDSFFEVKTRNATLSVRGTSFSVEYDKESGETKVEVLEGTVWASHGGETEVLEKGDKRVIAEAQAEEVQAEGDVAVETAAPGTTAPETTEETIEVTEPVDNQYPGFYIYWGLENILRYPNKDIYSVYLLNYCYKNQEFSSEISGGYYTSYSLAGDNPDDIVAINYMPVNPMDITAHNINFDYIVPHKNEIIEYFTANQSAAIERFRNGEEAEETDVTEWFPETLTLNGRNRNYIFHISSVMMSVSQTYTSAEYVDNNNSISDSYIDGDRCVFSDGVCFCFNGSFE